MSKDPVEKKDLPQTKVATGSFDRSLANTFGFDSMRSLTILVVGILALRWSVISPYHVPTGSMEPTIKIGDRLLAFKLTYGLTVPFTDWKILTWGKPKRGDIIVFKYPEDPSIDFVKRVVGVAGDHIMLKDEILYINGESQARESNEFDRSILDDIGDKKSNKLLYQETLAGKKHWTMQVVPAERFFSNPNFPENGGEYVVPEDSVFVMGDNRDNSMDSRKWKEVPLGYIHGTAEFVLWSAYEPEDSTEWFHVGSFSFKSFRVRWTRFGHLLN